MSQDRSSPDERNYALDGLRGLAALAVALGHCVLTVTGPDVWGLTLGRLSGHAPAEIAGRLAYLVFPSDAAVTLFFVLSGHVLWESFFKKYPAALRAFPDYLLARLYRLMPVAIAGAIPLGLIAGTFGPPADAREIVETMLLISLKSNGVLWSLQVEVVCSLALFFVWLGVGRSRLRLLVALVACFVLYRVTKNAYLLSSISFVAGALVTVAPERLRRSVPSLILGLVLLVGTSLLIGHGWRSRYGETLGAYLVIVYVRAMQPALLVSRAVHVLGLISYPFYVTHVVGMQLAGPAVTHLAASSQVAGVALYALISLAITIPLAWAIHVAIEMPALRGRPRLPAFAWPRRAPVPPKPAEGATLAPAREEPAHIA
jgi:peptidoglycan/LPS O-acetylase OafA/YrhL